MIFSVRKAHECLYMQLDMLDRSQLASRLTLNCTDSYIEPQKLKDIYVTIMDVRAMLYIFSDEASTTTLSS